MFADRTSILKQLAAGQNSAHEAAASGHLIDVDGIADNQRVEIYVE